MSHATSQPKRRRSRARRALVLLLRDARGRFMRVLRTVAELAPRQQPRRLRRRRSTVTAAAQLALF